MEQLRQIYNYEEKNQNIPAIIIFEFILVLLLFLITDYNEIHVDLMEIIVFVMLCCTCFFKVISYNE